MNLSLRVAPALLLALLGVPLLTGTATAHLIGESVHVEYLLPDSTTVAQDGGTQIISASTSV